MTNAIANQMCQTAAAYGLSKNKRNKIIDTLQVQLSSSGPDFVIGRLKQMRDAEVNKLAGNQPDYSWIKNNGERPTDPIGSVLTGFRKSKTRIQVLGAMINDVQYFEPTDNQVKKFEKGLRDPENTWSLNASRYQPEKEYHVGCRLKRLEKVLAYKIAKQSVFSLSDLTGTSIPTFSGIIKVKHVDEPGDRERTQKDILTQGQAFLATLSTAPAFAGQMELDSIKFVQEKYPKLRIKDLDARKEIAQYVKDNGQNLTVDYWDSSYLRDDRFGLNQRIGQISFLQERGGKMRVVANPNRYVQHLFRPLQHVLIEASDVPGNYYSSQTAGIEEIRDKIRLGKIFSKLKLSESSKISSNDLSSATDTLDFDNFIDEVLKPQSGSLLEIQLDSFSYASKAYWYSPYHGEDLTWKQGQPMGLAPSFAMLSCMNVHAAQMAQVRVESVLKAGPDLDNPKFTIVGDDCVTFGDKMSRYYNENIVAMGGSANPEKALVSHQAAEFCSQIITADTSFSKKPKIRKVYSHLYVDSERVPYKRLPGYIGKKDIMSLELLEKYSSSDIDNLPHVISSKSLPIGDKVHMSRVLKLGSFLEKDDRGPRDLTLGPLLHFSEKVAESDMNDPFITDHRIPVDVLVKGTIAGNKLTYDWKTKDYVFKRSPITSARDLVRSIEKALENTEEVDSMVSTDVQDPYHSDMLHSVMTDKETGQTVVSSSKDGKPLSDLDIAFAAGIEDLPSFPTNQHKTSFKSSNFSISSHSLSTSPEEESEDELSL